jgi:hypothetical protein
MTKQESDELQTKREGLHRVLCTYEHKGASRRGKFYRKGKLSDNEF